MLIGSKTSPALPFAKITDPRVAREMADVPSLLYGTYIYALCDPRDQTARYVGKTNCPDVRLLGHVLKTHQNKPLRSWIAMLDEKGLFPEMNVLQVCRTDEWERAERSWIGFFRSIGRVYNVEAGGERPVPKMRIDIRPSGKRRLSAKARANRRSYYQSRFGR